MDGGWRTKAVSDPANTRSEQEEPQPRDPDLLTELCLSSETGCKSSSVFHVDFEPSQEDFGASCPKCHSRALLQPCRARRGREEPINPAPTANTHPGWWQVPKPNLPSVSWAWGAAPALPKAAPHSPHSPHSPPSAANSPQ